MMPAPTRRRVQRETVRSATIPAPIGGINTIDAGSAMSPTDAILLGNLVAAEYGLRTRLGSREWCTGLTGSGNNEVRTVLPFTGSLGAGGRDRLFAATTSGIWDATASSAAPAQSIAFTSTDAQKAGWGNSCVFVNFGGNHFLLYCDEANGYHVYTESNGTWTAVPQAASTAWVAGATYNAGDKVYCNGASYNATTGGVAAATGLGPTGNGAAIADGTVVWAYYPSISGADPTKFAQVNVWANRVWFVERDTGHAWYTGIGALFGAVTKFVFGSRFKAGGDLRGLFNWTIDGGSGMTTSLVAISGGGDVVIYQGTDPSSVATFQLKGVWSLGGGGVPAGRRIATDYGGDLLILTAVGVLPLSKLVMGSATQDAGQYATQKIGNLFAKLMAATRTYPGWSIRLHPNDNTVLINVPQPDGTTQQLAMSLHSRGWSTYTGLPTYYASESWSGGFYLGTTDGRVLLNTDYVDGVKLDGTGATAITWSLLTSFQTLGSQRKKIVGLIRPQFLSSGGGASPAAAARYDYDFSALSSSGSSSAGGSNTWDTAVWDTAVWGSEYNPVQSIAGASGCGVAVAIALQGSTSVKLSLVGIDVMWQEGGFL